MSQSPPSRCPWCGTDPLYVAYHDHEWGVPVRDDRTFFEFLVLESAQAGLSWLTILRKRENFRRAFEGFDAERVARMDESRVEALLGDPGIIRNRRKIEATITNARAFLRVQEEWGTFTRYLWDFVDGAPLRNRWRTMAEVPATTPLAERLSRDMKARGFRFLGPTVLYAHLQATGLVNDHLVDCFRWEEVGRP